MENQQTTWAQVGVIWLAVAILLGLLFWPVGLLTKDRSPGPSVSKEVRDLSAKKNDSAAFAAGYRFGVGHKQTGLKKLSEQELDVFALQMCDQLQVPDQLRGPAVTDFKNGYGWGFWIGK